MGVLAVLCLSAPPAAFAGMEDLKVGVAITNGSDSDFGLGARVEYDLAAVVPNLGIAGGLNLFFPGDPYDSWWEVHTAALYRFKVDETFTPYAGGGLTFASWGKKNQDYDPFGTSSGNGTAHDSSFALTVIGGCAFDFDIGFTPFIEARVGVGGGNSLEITTGALIGF